MKLIIKPGHSESWESFVKDAPEGSIALDGYVTDAPKITPHHINFNHHERVSRLETRSTCAQVLLSVRQGLPESYPHPMVYVNDCDQDVCLSLFILRNMHMAESVINPLLNQLVFMEDMLDSTSGFYSFPANLPSLAKILWVFQPYTLFRSSGGLGRKNGDEYRMVIDNVCDRIMAYLVGKAESIEIRDKYEVLSQEKGFSVVKETEEHSRLGIVSDGIKAFVSVKELKEGKHSYILAMKSSLIPFDLVGACKELNQLEGCIEGDTWGGSDICIGSPRYAGSSLGVEQVVRVMKKYFLKG